MNRINCRQYSWKRRLKHFSTICQILCTTPIRGHVSSLLFLYWRPNDFLFFLFAKNRMWMKRSNFTVWVFFVFFNKKSNQKNYLAKNILRGIGVKSALGSERGEHSLQLQKAVGGNCLKDELICPGIMQSVTSKLRCCMLILTNRLSPVLISYQGVGKGSRCSFKAPKSEKTGLFS